MLAGVVIAQALAWSPMHAAAPPPPGVTALTVLGGFTLLRVDLPVLPVLPVLTGDAELAWALGRRVTVRARYTTWLGLKHRLGPELRVAAPDVGGLTVAARLHPTAQFEGAFQEGVDYGGDVATLAGLVATWRWSRGALTAEAGVTAQWVVYEHLSGRAHVDARPYLASVDAALEYEWPTRDGQTLSVRLELDVPTAPDDPSTVGGVTPRALFGGSFGL